jgi:hypothetical protein
MDTTTLYHATSGENKESIQQQGLQAGDLRDYVFLAGSESEARELGEIYPEITDPVVFEVEVADHKIKPDPEPHGDYDSFAHRGDIAPRDIECLDDEGGRE